jgi:hypothetical protein
LTAFAGFLAGVFLEDLLIATVFSQLKKPEYQA